jgi:hypothetical protein
MRGSRPEEDIVVEAVVTFAGVHEEELVGEGCLVGAEEDGEQHEVEVEGEVESGRELQN